MGPDLTALEAELRRRLAHNLDVRFRPLRVAGHQALLIYLEPVVDKEMLQRDLLRPLTELTAAATPEDLLHAVHVAEAAPIQPEIEKLVQAVTAGDSIALVDRVGALCASVIKPEHRSVQEPAVENTTRGARDSFTEVLRTNLGLIRIRLKDPRLVVEAVKVGRRTQSRCAVLYLRDVADEAIVEVVRDRLQAIDEDGVVGDAMVQEYLSDRIWSPFPQLRPTERPDWLVWEVLQGKVAVLVEGSATGLLGPVGVLDFYRSPEDYKHGTWEAIYVRLVLRFVGFVLALYLPGLYVALTDVTPDLLPTDLALSIAGSREGIPFPALVEVLFMEGALELLREATLRMPRLLAASVGIVGGLVLGQAAVAAKVVSDIMIIVISLTAMAQFVVPSQEMSVTWRILRWLFTLCAAFYGVYGLALISFVMLFHMAGLQSLGVPYLAPISPLHRQVAYDGLLRLPMRLMRRRPKLNHPQDEIRAGNYRPPHANPDLEQMRRGDDDGAS